jgi:hypothetical protein
MLCTFSAVIVSLCLAADSPTPLEIAKKLDELCRAEKLDEAQALFFSPNDAAKESAQTLTGHLKKTGVHKIIEELVSGDYAVVATLSSPTDPDPLLLIKRDGKWQILPLLAIVPMKELGLADKDWEELGKLYKTFRMKKKTEYTKLK